MMFSHRLVCLLIAGVALSATSLDAQERVSLTRSVQPSFRIEPVVQRFRARRGEILPFRFEIQSTGKSMTLDVKAVALRQEDTGVIMHDHHSLPASGVTFTSPTRFDLAAGETLAVTGNVTVPLTKTNFLSFGILVRDSGQLSDEATTPDDNDQTNQTQASVRFVTQYVLRVDVETGSQDTGEMSSLHFESASLIANAGMPWMRAYLVNPTNYALECQVRGRLNDASGRESDEAKLFMPCRAALLDDEKFLVRIMPNSRLRLESPLDGIVQNGDYELSLRVSNGRRVMVHSTFRGHVESSQFGAMATKVASIRNGVSLQPAQLELGRIKDTPRMSTLVLENRTDANQTLSLTPRNHEGQPLRYVLLSSDEFTLRPGRTKTVRAVLRGRASLPWDWGFVTVDCRSETGEIDTYQLPLSLIHQERPETKVTAGELQWAQLDRGNAFTMMVTNSGNGFTPVDGELQLAAQQGHPFKLADGFGRWLPPGETAELKFMVPPSIQPGPHQINLRVRARGEEIIAEKTLVIELTDEMLGSVPPNRSASASGARSGSAG